MTRMSRSLASSSTALTQAQQVQAFLTILSLTLVTLVYYNAIKNQTPELAFDQLTALNTHTHFLSNTTIFLPPLPTDHTPSLLTSLTPQTWQSLNSKVSHVVLLHTTDAKPFLENDDWLRRALKALQKVPVPRSIGIALFRCGCVIPDAWFRKQPVRFGGNECLLLPGFVMGRERVVWVGEKGEQAANESLCDDVRVPQGIEAYEGNIISARKEWHHVLEKELDTLSKNNIEPRDGLRPGG